MIYLKYIKILLKSFWQYRFSTWLVLVGQFFGTFFSFFGIYLLFDRFGNISGWTFGEAAICFAVVHTAFSVSECFARGFDLFSRHVVSGEFDRVLLRPRSTLLQVFGLGFEITRMGRLIQSAVVLGIAISQLKTEITVMKAVTLLLMVVCGVFIFTGIFILGATVCFFTVEGLEIINIFTDGGREIAQYPLNIYNKWLVRFFTFIVPFGCFNYLPLMYITGKAAGNETLYMLMPMLGILFVIPCILIWNAGVKRYLSTGS